MPYRVASLGGGGLPDEGVQVPQGLRKLQLVQREWACGVLVIMEGRHEANDNRSLKATVMEFSRLSLGEI
jgi:hypothetical protein